MRRPRYELREKHTFLARVQQEFPSIRHWDDIFFNYDFVISHDPKQGTQIGTSDIYFIWIRVEPIIALYYQVNDDDMVVTLLDIHRFDPP